MYQSPYYYGTGRMPLDPNSAKRKHLRREVNRSAWGVLSMLIAMSALSIIMESIVTLLGFGETETGALLSEIGSGIAYAAGAFLPFLVTLLVLKNHWNINDLLPFKKVSFGIALSTIVLGFAVCMLANIPANVISALIESTGLNGDLPDMGSPISAPEWIAYMIDIAVIPALVEEFAFRGIILSRLRKFGDGFAVVATAIMFALYHGNVIQFIFAFLIGLYFGFIMVKTNNLWITIAIHALNNGYSVLMQFVYKYCTLEAADMIQAVSFLITIILGIGALIYIVISHRTRLFGRKERCNGLRFGTKICAFITNPGFIALLIYSLINAVIFLTVDFSALGY